MVWDSEAIKALRADYEETQEVFARRLRVHPDALRKWEQGRGTPSGPAQVVLDVLRAVLAESSDR